MADALVMADAPARVVLLDDDVAMRLYAQAALQHLDIDLLCCASIAQGIAALCAGPVRLVITDLLLQGESGLDFIEQLQAEPLRFGRPRIVVSSSGLDAPGLRRRLKRLGVTQLLAKPVSLEAIQSCVLEATCRSASALGAAELFGADEPVYAAYRKACLARLARDADAGEGWLRAADHAQLHRLAHNLAPVLQALGEPAAAACARRLEDHLEAGDQPAAAREWPLLRNALQAIARPWSPQAGEAPRREDA